MQEENDDEPVPGDAGAQALPGPADRLGPSGDSGGSPFLASCRGDGETGYPRRERQGGHGLQDALLHQHRGSGRREDRKLQLLQAQRPVPDRCRHLGRLERRGRVGDRGRYPPGEIGEGIPAGKQAPAPRGDTRGSPAAVPCDHGRGEARSLRRGRPGRKSDQHGPRGRGQAGRHQGARRRGDRPGRPSRRVERGGHDLR